MAFQTQQERPDGSVLALSPTGQQTLLTPQNAAALRAAGNLAPAGGGGWQGMKVPNQTPFAPQNMSVEPPRPLPPMGPPDVQSRAPTPQMSSMPAENMTPAAPNMSSPEMPNRGVPQQRLAIPAARQSVFQQSQQRAPQPGVPSDLFIRGRAAQWSPDRREVSGLTDERMKALEEHQSTVQDMQMQALKSQAEAGISHNEKIVSQNQEAITRNNLQNEALALPLKQKQEEFSTNMQALDAERQKVRDGQVDPDQWHKNIGTGGSLLAAVAMGMGEWARIKSGGNQNMAANLIQRSIDHNVESQLANLRKVQGDYQNSQEFFDKYGARDLNELKIKQQMLGQDTAVRQLRIDAAQESLAFMRPNLLATAAQLEEAAGKNYLEIAKSQDRKASEKYLQATPGGISVNPARLAEQKWRKGEAEIAKDLGENAKNTDATASENNIVMNGQVVARAGSKPTVERLQAKADHSVELYGVITEARDLISKASATGNAFTTKEKARLESLIASARPLMNVSQGQGGLSEGDRANLEKALPDSIDALRENGAARLDASLDVIRKGTKRTFAQYGANQKEIDAAFDNVQHEEEKE